MISKTFYCQVTFYDPMITDNLQTETNQYLNIKSKYETTSYETAQVVNI